MKKSFTMVEIIFVIVILAIVAGGTFEFILKVYQTYARAKTVDRLQTELDLALTQISNRLAYRIKDSVIYGGDTGVVNYLADSPSKQENILEWIGYDREGLMGMWNGSAIVPGWSGFSDRNLMTSTTIKSLGSNLKYANQIVSELSNPQVTLTNSRVALIIPSSDGIMRYGWYEEDGNNSFIVNCSDMSCSDGEDSFTYSNSDPEYSQTKFDDRNDTDRYYLAWSAYALIKEDTNLYLYYNYQPWANTPPTKYTDNTAPNNALKSLLLQNVNLFEFWQNGNTIWIRICMDSENQDTLSLEDSGAYGFCKERAIY